MDSPFAAISCVCFSYTRPAVFAAGSRDGFVYIFDLLSSLSGPVVILRLPPVGATSASIAEASSTGKRLTGARARVSGLSFNKKQRDLLAACDNTGRVFVWKMGWSLSNLKQAELSFVEHLGRVNPAADDEGSLAES
jgi:WD40 repeat protein